MPYGSISVFSSPKILYKNIDPIDNVTGTSGELSATEAFLDAATVAKINYIDNISIYDKFIFAKITPTLTTGQCGLWAFHGSVIYSGETYATISTFPVYVKITKQFNRLNV